MPAKILDGRRLAADLRAGLAARVVSLKERGIQPRVVVALVGKDASSLTYVRGIERLGPQIGVTVDVDLLPPSIDEAGVRGVLERYGTDPTIHGVIVQQPLPPTLSMRRIADAMPPEKDVDGANPANQGRLAFATGAHFVPATPQAVMLLLERSEKWPLGGRDVTVIGRSSVVGLPVSLLLVAQNATVTVVHSKTKDVAAHACQAEILVVAIGKPGTVAAPYVRPGATVIDVGITVVDGALCGDVDYESVSPVAGEITPVPGGVGPVTNVALMRNVVTAAEQLAR